MTSSIRLQVQGPNECFPTSLCMVLGVDWEVLRQVIVTEINRRLGLKGSLRKLTWGETSGYNRDIAIWTLIDYLGLPDSDRETGYAVGHVPRGRAPKLRIPRGTGLMSLHNARSGLSHIVAFHRGKVYDPCGPMVYTEKDFDAHYRIGNPATDGTVTGPAWRVFNTFHRIKGRFIETERYGRPR